MLKKYEEIRVLGSKGYKEAMEDPAAAAADFEQWWATWDPTKPDEGSLGKPKIHTALHFLQCIWEDCPSTEWS